MPTATIFITITTLPNRQKALGILTEDPVGVHLDG